MVGIAPASGRNFQQSTDEYIRGLLQSNPYLRQQTNYRRGSLGGREALAMQLAGRSDVTGRNEIVTVYTTQMRDGNLFYFITIAPQNEAGTYNNAFSTIMRSLQLNG
jgi:hypothetical protein